MATWVFESGAQDTYTGKANSYVKVELLKEDISNWYATPATSIDALAGLDWTAATITCDEFPFDIPDLQFLSSVEANVAGNSHVTMDAINLFVAVDGVNVTSGNLVEGNWYKVIGAAITYDGVSRPTGTIFQANSTLTFTGATTLNRIWTVYEILTDPGSEEVLHVRISSKSTSGGSYVVRYSGVLKPESITRDIWDTDNPTMDSVQFAAEDVLQLLTRKTAKEWMNANTGGLKHVDYDYTASYTFLTFVGDFDAWGTTLPAGRYIQLKALVRNHTGGGEDREYDLNNTTNLRFIKLVDVFQSISDFMGLEADVNNGAAWSNFHSWDYYYNSNNSTGAGGETLNAVQIDDLYVISALMNGAAYDEQYTFFDPYDTAEHSWKRAGDPLEVLRRICESNGLTFRVRVNSSGERYLEIIESARMSTTKTISSGDSVLSITERPNGLAISGIEIVSPGSVTNSADVASDVVRGSSGNGAQRYDCYFNSTNHLRSNYAFAFNAGTGTDVGGALISVVQPVDTDWYCTLWTLTGLTGKAATNAYSICLWVPKSSGSVASADYTDAPEYGEFRTGVGVSFPDTSSSDPQFYTYIETPAMALSHYLFNTVGESVDPVGFTRPRGAGIEIEEIGIDHDAVTYPPIKLTLSVGGVSKDYVVTEIKEDHKKITTTYTGHTREA